MKKILIITAFIFTNAISAPFVCDDKMYINLVGQTTSNLNYIDTATYPFSLTPLGSSQPKYNAMGYNPADNLIYGILTDDTSPPVLVSIDDTGTSVPIGVINGLPQGFYFSGDIGSAPDYHLFLHVPGMLYEVDTQSLTVVNTISLNSTNEGYDIAFDKTTDTFYGVTNNSGHLFRIDPTSGTLTLIGNSSSTTFFGSMFADDTGKIYGNSNDTNEFFLFDKTTGNRIVISNQTSGAGDGAFCQDATISLKDYGDAPQLYGAANHNISAQLYMGRLVDMEESSHYSANATGDNVIALNDEDGISIINPILLSNSSYSIDIQVNNTLSSGSIKLFAWIDFDRNGAFDYDEVASSNNVVAGINTLTFNYNPNDLSIGTSFMRVRLDWQETPVVLQPTGAGGFGEVEDYQIEIRGVVDINLLKQCSFVDANANGLADVGENIHYTFEVTNGGNQTLHNISISDPLITVQGSLPILSVGTTDNSTFYADYPLTQADIDAGVVRNTATVTATNSTNQATTDSSNCDINLPLLPDINLLKQCSFVDANANGLADVGENIHYTFEVTNGGNQTLHNISISDPLITVQGSLPILSVGTTDNSTFYADYPLTQADIDAGVVRNTATVTATNSTNQATTDSSNCDIQLTVTPPANVKVPTINKIGITLLMFFTLTSCFLFRKRLF